MLDKSSEYIIETPNGCVQTKTVKRVPVEDAKNPVLFSSVVGESLAWGPQEARASGAAYRTDEDRPTRVGNRTEAVSAAELPEPVVLRASGPSEFTSVVMWIWPDMDIRTVASDAPRQHSTR